MVEEAFALSLGRQAALETGAPKLTRMRLDAGPEPARRILEFFVESECLFRRSSKVELADAKKAAAAGVVEVAKAGRKLRERRNGFARADVKQLGIGED